ncbi:MULTISPECIES: response regulator transcription factor [Pseudomonas]|uniref:Response regulator transcription factor n=1 Tax=Pseudomonas saxonica TaxID=2600598 RepID=A0ABY3GIN4_9PSED|nr:MULTISPECIES: response regulator transcription factor [Pseudomonas]MCH4874979.1 response regulator transcription factor [Pseudomonas sp. TMW22091]TWR90267.1 response regulator transcription factor [Pseudomonas saxonica]WRQ76220.1 response regulator transcription factor [Pseudomonas saxonica]
MRKALIVDDHPFIRRIVRSVLEQSNFQIAAETDNGATALDLARAHIPHLMVLDLSMPKLDGLEVLKRLHILGLPIKVLVLTSKGASYYADRCIRAGAIGFIEKTEDVDALTKAINIVMSGQTYLSNTDVNLPSVENEDLNDIELIKTLSDREMHTLLYLVAGMSNKKISEIMLLSEKTVSTYKTRVMTKLNIKSVVYLAEFAKRNNLIE